MYFKNRFNTIIPKSFHEFSGDVNNNKTMVWFSISSVCITTHCTIQSLSLLLLVTSWRLQPRQRLPSRPWRRCRSWWRTTNKQRTQSNLYTV